MLTLLAAGVLLGACGNASKAPQEPAAPATPAAKTDAFLKEARQIAQEKPAAGAPETGLLPPATDSSNIPVIEADPAALDMGVISREGPSTGEIKIRNKGKATLEISQVSQSCGCVKASIDPKKRSVPPGGETVVTVTVDPKRIPSFESTKDVYVTSNDPKMPRLSVKVSAKIDPEFAVEPAELDFGDVPKGTVAEKTLLFRQLSDEPIEIQELRPLVSKSTDLDLSFAKRPEAEWKAPDRSEYVITVRLPADLSPGKLSGSFAIQSTCKRLPSFPCKVNANVTAFYDIGPARQLIVRGGLRPGQGGTSSTTVAADRPFEIQDLQVSGEDLTVSSKAGTAPNSQVIEVALKAEANPGQRNEAVTFTIKSGGEVYKERVPVRVYSAKAQPMLRPGFVPEAAKRRPPRPLLRPFRVAPGTAPGAEAETVQEPAAPPEASTEAAPEPAPAPKAPPKPKDQPQPK
jgi:hypothetical protein